MGTSRHRSSRTRPGSADLPLRELVLDSLPGKRNLLGVERWHQKEHLSIRGVPRPDEVQALAKLPALTRLTIAEAETPGGGGLTDLRTALPNVEIDPELGPVLGATRHWIG